MNIKYLTIFLISILSLSIIGSVNAANKDILSDRVLLDEKAKYYHSEFGAECLILKLYASKLKHGDYIQLRDFKDEVSMYLFRDTNGYVYFSNTYGTYKCKQDIFDRAYTGYALLINY